MNPSPRAHVYRLLVLLFVGAAAFLAVKTLAVPSSWDAERWFRTDAEKEAKHLPIRYGGNPSCAGSTCHDEAKPAAHDAQLQILAIGPHKGLACEGCHGPLRAHVQDARAIAEARVDTSSDLCLGCHRPLVSRPTEFVQFSEEILQHRLLKVRESSSCRRCHDPHHPLRPRER